MNISSFLIVTAVTVAVLILAYKRSSPALLPTQKPPFCFLPKYDVPINAPISVSGAADPIAALDRVMRSLGFAQLSETENFVGFGRGSLLGDFSVRIAKVRVEFSLPLTSDLHCRVVYGSFAAFDTGDLWTLCSEIKNEIESAT